MNKKMLLIASAALFLTACGGGSDDETQVIEAPVASIESSEDLYQSMRSEGTLPRLDRSDSLAGVDDDNNGVRDDIQGFIDASSLNSTQKSAAHNVAYSLQQIQTAETLDADAAALISQDSLTPLVCLMSSFNELDAANEWVQRLESYTANTESRATRYHEYNTLRSGSVIRLPENVQC